MGRAIVTVAGHAANPGATFTAPTLNTGDSFTVPNFAVGSAARLEAIIRGGATKGSVRVRSPRLHDDTIGIKVRTDLNPSVFLIPPEISQMLQSGDALDVAVTGGTAETDVVALRMAFDDLPGANANLKMWGDISSIIANLHAFEVDVTNSATIGTWTDTVITNNDNVLKANADYAVLGFTTDVVQTVVAFRSPETGNYRIGSSGTDQSDDTSDWFVSESERTGLPHIPVFNANNRQNAFVSTCDVVASSTPIITLVVAELSQRVT